MELTATTKKSKAKGFAFGRCSSSMLVWMWLVSVEQLFVTLTLKYIYVQVGVYVLCVLNLSTLTMIGGEVKIIEGYGSRVNFHSNLWPECLFWTFRGLNNNSSFIDPEKAAQSVKM